MTDTVDIPISDEVAAKLAGMDARIGIERVDAMIERKLLRSIGAKINSDPHPAVMRIADDPDRASFKRLAWAYGCAGAGSAEESKLRQALTERVRSLS
jgi:hypothetical protein